jgi:hypothetical protein
MKPNFIACSFDRECVSFRCLLIASRETFRSYILRSFRGRFAESAYCVASWPAPFEVPVLAASERRVIEIAGRAAPLVDVHADIDIADLVISRFVAL